MMIWLSERRFPLGFVYAEAAVAIAAPAEGGGGGHGHGRVHRCPEEGGFFYTILAFRAAGRTEGQQGSHGHRRLLIAKTKVLLREIDVLAIETYVLLRQNIVFGYQNTNFL